MTMQYDDKVSRGAVSAAGAAAAAGAVARAPQPRAKGPLVWLDMDQQALDDAYDQIVYAPNREQVAKRRIANSEQARAAIGAPARVAYGATEIEKLDIYRTSRANAPVNIFVHGGAWRANRAADYACLAEPFVRAGGISSSSTSPMSTMPAAASFPWSSRCDAPLAGSTRTPRASAATPAGSI